MEREIIFSAHALSRMKERFISKKVVINATRNPDKIEKSSQMPSRFLIKKVYFNKILRKEHLLMVICELLPKQIEIITIIDTSKISKYF